MKSKLGLSRASLTLLVSIIVVKLAKLAINLGLASVKFIAEKNVFNRRFF